MVRREHNKPNPEAGLELLKMVKDLPEYEDTPVFFYVSYTTVGEYRERVDEAGGKGISISDSRLRLFREIDERAEAVERGGPPMAEETV